jgi:hypothetical protein
MKNKFGFSSQELNLETRVRNAGEPCEWGTCPLILNVRFG